MQAPSPQAARSPAAPQAGGGRGPPGPSPPKVGREGVLWEGVLVLSGAGLAGGWVGKMDCGGLLP
jgi:hypothetical protein